jgi:hypothetical protein
VLNSIPSAWLRLGPGLLLAVLLFLTGCEALQTTPYDTQAIIHRAQEENIRRAAARGSGADEDPLAAEIRIVTADIERDWAAAHDLKASWHGFLYPGSSSKVPDEIIRIAVNNRQQMQSDEAYLGATRTLWAGVNSRCQALTAESSLVHKLAGDDPGTAGNQTNSMDDAGFDAVRENIQSAWQQAAALKHRLDDYFFYAYPDKLTDSERNRVLGVGDAICAEKDYLKALRTYRTMAEKQYAAVQAECQVYEFWRESLLVKHRDWNAE